MAFCSNCGEKLNDGAKFCHACGTPVNVANRVNSQRKTVYEGIIHKCPNCGEVLDSFTTNCPSCGWEIRATQSASGMREFTSKLERIEARQMPHVEVKKSTMKKIFGTDFKSEEDDEVLKAKKIFEQQKEQEKVSLIISFAVPNTKEDFLEFILLACSNINTRKGITDEVSKAWITKLDQVYQKATISIHNESDLQQITEIYEKKKRAIRRKKLFPIIRIAIPILILAIMIGMATNPTGTIVAVVIVLAGFIAFIIFSIRKKLQNH